MITYADAENYISDIPKFAGKHTVEDVRRRLERIGAANLRSKIIHVAGTNGKGSVCAYLRSVLMESGCTAGVFTSPHLEVMRERICLGEEMISGEDFIRIFQRVKETLSDEGKKEQDPGHPSFFEFLFLMAMAYFAEKTPDYIILETGLGGRLDATNSVEHKELCVITEIGFDHMQYLGNTLKEIGAEKAGIIRPGVPVVFADKRDEVTEILKAYAEKTKSSVYILEKGTISEVNIGNKTIDFSLHTGYYNYVGLSLSTRALYQTENASLAVLASELLGRKDGRITKETIRRGLKKAYWPGRMEEVLPGVFLDGAHNEDGIEAFLNTAGRIACAGRRLLLFGVAADKNYERMIGQLVRAGIFDEAAVAPLASDRSASLEQMKEIWGQYNQVYCSFHKDAEEAYRYLSAKKKDADIIYIAGSLYLIGQMKALVRR